MAFGIVDNVRSFFDVFRGRKALWTTPRLGASVAIAAGVVMEDAWLDEKAEAKQNAARQYWSARNLMMRRLLVLLSECIILVSKRSSQMYLAPRNDLDASSRVSGLELSRRKFFCSEE